MRKTPFTTTEFFNTICDVLKEKGEYPAILDYALPTRKELPIPTEEFHIESHLSYGGSEGIYLDLYLHREDDEYLNAHFSEEDDKAYSLGTFKTLSDNHEAMRTMGLLLADFIVESNHYVHQHLEDFNWQGYDVYPSDEDGKNIELYKFTCSTEKRAKDRARDLLEDHDYVTIRNNKTRELSILEAQQIRPFMR